MRNKIQLHIASVSLALFLGACGGGGVENTQPSTASTGTAQPTPSEQAPTANESLLKALVVPSGFKWETKNANTAVSLRLNRSSGAAIGDVRITVSNFIDEDPTGSGEKIAPISTDVITSTLANVGSASTLTVPFGSMVLPASTTEVLVEVFSQQTGVRLTSSLISTEQLLKGTSSLTY